MPSSSNRNRWILGSVLAALVAIQLVAFQNCGSDFVVKDGLSFASGATCADALQSQFESSYYPFLKTNCAACHTGAGPGQGAFAANDPSLAFNAFLLATDGGSDTASKLDANATNTAHAGASYTGPQNTSAITLASQAWAAADAMCKTGGGPVAPAIITARKPMNASTASKDISFNLDTDIASGSPGSVGGATLTIAVTLAVSPNGSSVYYFSNPRLKGGSRAVSLTGLMVRLNGQEQTLGSTWSRVNGIAAAGATTVLSGATMIIQYDNAVPASDTLSLTIDALSAQ